MFFKRTAKKLMYDVKVQGADPRFGKAAEQFAAPPGTELALNYWTGFLSCRDKAFRDMLHRHLLSEEFSSHLKIVSAE